MIRRLALYSLLLISFLYVLHLFSTQFSAQRLEIISRLVGSYAELPVEKVVAYSMLIGEFKKLETRTKEHLISAGLIHVVVASGYNLSLVANFMLALPFLRRRKLRLALACSGCYMYSLLAGLGMPVIRSFLMFTLATFAKLYGRRVSTLWLVFISFLLLVAGDYLSVFNISAQLSFGATLGMILFAQKFEDFSSTNSREAKGFLSMYILEPMVTTIGANSLVLPIIAFYFGRVSVFFIISNVLTLWLVPYIMLAVFSELVLGLLGLQVFAAVLSTFAVTLTSYFLFVAEIFSCSWCVIEFSPTLLSIFLYYALLLYLMVLLKPKKALVA